MQHPTSHATPETGQNVTASPPPPPSTPLSCFDVYNQSIVVTGTGNSITIVTTNNPYAPSGLLKTPFQSCLNWPVTGSSTSGGYYGAIGGKS